MSVRFWSSVDILLLLLVLPVLVLGPVPLCRQQSDAIAAQGRDDLKREKEEGTEEISVGSFFYRHPLSARNSSQHYLLSMMLSLHLDLEMGILFLSLGLLNGKHVDLKFTTHCYGILLGTDLLLCMQMLNWDHPLPRPSRWVCSHIHWSLFSKLCLAM